MSTCDKENFDSPKFCLQSKKNCNLVQLFKLILRNTPKDIPLYRILWKYTKEITLTSIALRFINSTFYV